MSELHRYETNYESSIWEDTKKQQEEPRLTKRNVKKTVLPFSK